MSFASSLPPSPAFFLHGLESSIGGTKAQWFKRAFPDVRLHNFDGDLDRRLAQLEEQAAGLDRLILVGSSFGGLMAACFAARHPERCKRLVLLAPALNFNGYRLPATPLAVPALLVIGEHDTVCPPDLVLPVARASFNHLQIQVEDDDHLLHRTFPVLDWPSLLDMPAPVTHGQAR